MLRNFLRLPVASPLLDPNIFRSTLFSIIFSLCFPFRDQVSYHREHAKLQFCTRYFNI